MSTQRDQDIQWNPSPAMELDDTQWEPPTMDVGDAKVSNDLALKAPLPPLDIEMPDTSTTAHMDVSCSSDGGDSEVFVVGPKRSWNEDNREVSFTQSNDPKPLSSWSASLIIVNTISMGYILNPSGFAQGGTLLGAVCLALVSFQSMITGVFVLEACTRAEMLKASIFVGSFHERRARCLEGEEDEEDNVIALRQKVDSKARRWLPRSHSLRIHQRTFELSELCRIFLGRWLRNLFTATSAGDLYGISWTLSVVFGSSLSEHIPMGTDYDYQLYVLIFMAVAVPVSCMRISVQVPMQVLFLLARTLMLLLMLGTLLTAYVSDQPHFGTQAQPAQETPLANWSSIVTVLQLCVFSTAYQFAVPGITAETANKSSMVGILVRSVSYIYATNLVLSLIIATYFGNSTQASANLNWLSYHGGTWHGEGDLERAWWATAISSYIVLFAALDGLAVYPLVCISLGDILMGAVYEDKVHDIMQDSWKIRIGFRLLACVPQAVGSLFLTDLGVIAKVAGIFTVMSYTICPAYLALQSRQAVADAKLPTNTKYSAWFTSNKVAYLLIVCASSLICGVFYDAFVSFTATAASDEIDVSFPKEDDLTF